MNSALCRWVRITYLEVLMKTLGEAIKEKRLQAGLTQEALAERIHTTRQTISNYELDNSEPKLDVLRDIAGTLGCDLGELVSADESPNGSFGDGQVDTKATWKNSKKNPSASVRTCLAAVIALLAAEFIILQFIDPLLKDLASKTFNSSLRMISSLVVQNMIMIALGFFALRLVFAALDRLRPAASLPVKILVVTASAALGIIHAYALADFLRMYFEWRTAASSGGDWIYSSQTSPVTNILLIPLGWVRFNIFTYRLMGILIGALLGLPSFKNPDSGR